MRGRDEGKSPVRENKGARRGIFSKRREIKMASRRARVTNKKLILDGKSVEIAPVIYKSITTASPLLLTLCSSLLTFPSTANFLVPNTITFSTVNTRYRRQNEGKYSLLMALNFNGYAVVYLVILDGKKYVRHRSIVYDPVSCNGKTSYVIFENFINTISNENENI